MHRNIHNPIKLTLLVLTHSLHFTKKNSTFIPRCCYWTDDKNQLLIPNDHTHEGKNSPLEGDSLIFIAAGQFWCRSFWENKHMDQKNFLFCCCFALQADKRREKKIFWERERKFLCWWTYGQWPSIKKQKSMKIVFCLVFYKWFFAVCCNEGWKFEVEKVMECCSLEVVVLCECLSFRLRIR